MHIEHAVIEVTRRCNMRCMHCLRGAPQNKDIPDDVLDVFFSKVESIGCIALTGGEPSLVPDRIRAVVKFAKKHKVWIGGFYMATNGKKVTSDFLMAMAELYAYCDSYDEFDCDLALSQDSYHDPVPMTNIRLLKAFSFFSIRENSERSTIREGRAKDWGYRDNELEDFNVEDDRVMEGNVYLNVNGEIISGCDWSYVSQKKHKVCDVKELCIEQFER